MSDPIANAEIEDVLLSIRRLVQGDRQDSSDGTDDDEDSSDSESQAATLASAGDALVLTPALLVSEAEPEEQPEHPEAPLWQVGSESDRGPDSRTGFGGLSAIGLPENLVSQGNDHDDRETDLLRDDELPGGSDDTEDGADFVPRFIRAVTHGVFEEEAEEVDTDEESVDPHADESDASNQPESQATRNIPRPGFRFGADQSDQRVEGQAEDEEPVSTEGNDEVRFPVDLGALLENGLTATGTSRSDTESADLDSAGVMSGDASAMEEPMQFSAADQCTGEDEPDGDITATRDDADQDSPFVSGGLPLDEAALREMVADLVHRELQGELGERITRNVRKLVRREIHRVLSSRDFD